MTDLLTGCTQVFDLVRWSRSQVKTVGKVAFVPGYASLLEHGIELPTGGTYKGHALALFVLPPGLSDKCYFVFHSFEKILV